MIMWTRWRRSSRTASLLPVRPGLRGWRRWDRTLERPDTVLRRFGAIEVDFGSHAAFVNRDGERRLLSLTLSEFRILAHMIRHPTQVFARADILDACLPESDALVRTVDTHVSNLRRKLEDMGEAGFFPAVRGVGYRLADPQ